VDKPEIMTKPLPQILDEMKENTRLAAEAAAAALRAKDEAMQSAEQARLSGEKAGHEAKEAAEKAIGEVKGQLGKRIDDMKLEMDEAIKKAKVEVQNDISYALMRAVEALEKAEEALILCAQLAKYPMAMMQGAVDGYNRVNKVP